MPTVTGTLETILGSEAVDGTVQVALCGYGSRVPRMNAQALAARITDSNVDINEDGTFQFSVIGNDEIAPDATYYTVTVKDDNGDIVQVNAYRFLSIQQTYDLNLIDPYDPNQPPPPLPPLILDLLQIVPWSDPVFDGSDYTSWQLTMTGDTTGAVVQNVVDGNLYTFILIQDATGGHSFEWPANVFNATPVNRAPNGTTIQTFVALDDTLYPIGAGTYFP